jgi:AraC-like DNA-binding protein
MIVLNATSFLVSSIQGFLLVLGLISKKSKNRTSNIAIGLIIFVISTELLFSWGGRSGYNNLPNAFPIWKLISYLIIPPALWLFLQANSEAQFKFSVRHLFLFLPAFVQIFLQIIPWLISQSLNSQLFKFIFNTKFWFIFTEILPIAMTIIVLFIYGKRLVNIVKKMSEFNNHTAKVHLQRMLIIFGFMCVILVLWILLVFFNIQLFTTIELLLVVSAFLLGYVAYFKPDFFEIPQLTQLRNQFVSYDDKQQVVRLNQIFEYKMLYTRPKLTVAEVAEELNLPVKYVSYLVGAYCGNNFNDFVNKFRVKEAIRRINEPSESHKTLLGIALDSGFSSKSAFNQVFKQHTGKTPSEYLP